MNKPWTKTYGPGVPHEIDADAYPSVVALFEKAVASYGDLPAFECFGKTMTYREVDAAARAVAAWLQTEARGQARRPHRADVPERLRLPDRHARHRSGPARRR